LTVAENEDTIPEEKEVAVLKLKFKFTELLETSLYGEGIGDVRSTAAIGIANLSDVIVLVISEPSEPLGDFNCTFTVKAVDDAGVILFIVIVFNVLEQESMLGEITVSILSCTYLT
jgi:hypothetical protein